MSSYRRGSASEKGSSRGGGGERSGSVTQEMGLSPEWWRVSECMSLRSDRLGVKLTLYSLIAWSAPHLVVYHLGMMIQATGFVKAAWASSLGSGMETGKIGLARIGALRLRFRFSYTQQ